MILSIAVLIIGVVLLVSVKERNFHSVATKTSPKAVAIRSEFPISLSSSMMFVGEVFWGRGIEYFANKSPLKFQFPFSGLSLDVHNKYNNWIGDMECPITAVNIPYQTQVDKLQFNCRPEYLAEASKWFSAFTLANNHMCDNRGEIGQQETRNNLENAKIQYFGDCHPSNSDNICEVIAINAESKGPKGETKTIMPIAMCGYTYVVDITPSDAELAVISKYAAVMPVIAMSHMGVEYRPIAEEAKVNAYHRMIDAGADVVLGAHPHVIQNSENYNGKLIQYSSGNFMFDQQSLGRNNILSLGIAITLEIKDKAATDAYQSIGSECAAFKDSCLEKLQSKIKTRPTIKVSYSPDCFTEPKYFPISADSDTCSEILKQATWETATTSLSSTW